MGNYGFKKLKPFFIFIQLAVTFASLITNWLFYYDIESIAPGLVFGPFPIEFRHTVLGLCVISSFLNLFELIFLFIELCRRRSSCYVSGNACSAVIIWLDDIPKVACLLYIASCHDRAISVVELARSCLLIVTAVIRFLAFSGRECYRRRRESQGLPTREEVLKRNRPCRCCIYGSILLGIVIKILGFCIIFLLTNLTTYDGRVIFKHPRGVMVAEPNVAKYTANVSIFAGVERRNETWGWFQLVPLSDMVFHKNCSTKINLKTADSKIQTHCGSNFTFSHKIATSPVQKAEDEVDVYLKFRFLEPDRTLLLGNVEYKTERSKLPPNARVTLKYFCSGVRASRDAIGYMLGLVGRKEFNYKGESTFGREKVKISTVPYCWRTGKYGCEMRGLLGPLHVSVFSVD